MSDNLKLNLTSSKQWLRLVYMLLFGLLQYVATFAMWLLVAVQFLFALITGNDNVALRRVCDSLSTYIYQIMRFLTYCSDDKPFPFSDWPEPEVSEEQGSVESEDEPPEAAPEEESHAGKVEAGTKESAQSKQQEATIASATPAERASTANDESAQQTHNDKTKASDSSNQPTVDVAQSEQHGKKDSDSQI